MTARDLNRGAALRTEGGGRGRGRRNRHTSMCTSSSTKAREQRLRLRNQYRTHRPPSADTNARTSESAEKCLPKKLSTLRSTCIEPPSSFHLPCKTRPRYTAIQFLCVTSTSFVGRAGGREGGQNVSKNTIHVHSVAAAHIYLRRWVDPKTQKCSQATTCREIARRAAWPCRFGPTSPVVEM